MQKKLAGQRTCTFCGASGPLTREHVIPIWLQRYVEENEGAQGAGHFLGTHLSWTGAPLSQRSASGNSHALRTVCRDCNNGWMAQLEGDFASLLPRLRTDQTPKKFSKSERRVISLWLLKTGIVAHRSSNFRPILPASLPQAITGGSSIPAGIIVFAGKIQREEKIQWVQSNIGVTMLREDDISTFDPLTQTFVFAISIIETYLGFGWHALDSKKYQLFLNIERTHQIYPHPKAARSQDPIEDILLSKADVGLRRRA